MKLSRIFVIVLTLLMLTSICVMADESEIVNSNLDSTVGIIGGADGPTETIVAGVVDTDMNQSTDETIENESEMANDEKSKDKESEKANDEKSKEKDNDEINLKFEPNNFIKNLSIMGKGMLGIFIVIGIIIIAVYILGAFNKSKKD